MKTAHLVSKSLVVGMAVLGLAGSASAQSSAPAEGRYTHAQSQEQRQAKWSERMAQHQQKLHDALQLTAAQEGAWTAFTASMKPAGAPAAHADRAALRTMPAPQRMEHAIDMARQHTATMEQHLAALKTFYAVLTPAQQKVFDEQTSRGHHGMRGHMQRG
jgi:protein CpxP